ncbi:MAG TPA: amidohydrolase family protein [Burkholderiales bacterium]|nr:amidohydrolase family protein [Burkholderiales bacterium]
MYRSRRKLIAAACGAAALGGCSFSFEHGLLNPCRGESPNDPAIEAAVLAAWEGIDATLVWDCHVHLVGEGDSGSGIWLHPAMRSVMRPLLYAQRLLYRNASCSGVEPGPVDDRYVERLQRLIEELPPGAKAVLLALDWHHTEDGEPLPAATAIRIPGEYAMSIAARHRGRFEWAASIHPYRRDCIAALRAAKANGACAVKWLPATMGIDPGSGRCDAFYAEIARLGLPLITHAGTESAVRFGEQQHLGNPLRLRRPLEHGVRVVVAHCATLGEDRDLDRGEDGPYVPSFELFARLMDDARYRENLYGDLSAVAQMNRAGRFLKRLLERRDWHARLLNGSDYPLPGVMPIHSLNLLVQLEVIEPAIAPVLAGIREYNPLLFDFVLKRHLRAGAARFPAGVFETRPFFQVSGVS